MEVLKEHLDCIFLQDFNMTLDMISEELEFTCGHQILTSLVLVEISDELIQERVEKELFRDIFMIIKYSFEASHDHFCGYLVDLFVTGLVAIVL